MFLLSNYGTLEVGKWPEKKTGYLVQKDADIQNTHTATDGKPVAEIKADLDLRINKLPKQVRRVLFDIDWEREWYALSQDARDIVNYLKGYEAKKINFSDWKKQGKYRKIGSR